MVKNLTQANLLKISGLLLLIAFIIPIGSKAQLRPLIWGTSPFQDSLWSVDTTTWAVHDRIGPTLAGFTVTGMNGMAYDPCTHKTFIIMKVSGVSGRVLGTIDLSTGVCTQIGNLGMNFSSLTFRGDGQLLGATGDNGSGGGVNGERLWLIDKTNAATTLAMVMGNGADGEIISFNSQDNMIYHWSGNGTVVFEKFSAYPPFVYSPVNIPISGSAGGESFGSIYLGNNKFIISNINSQFKYLSAAGVYGGTLSNLPDDLRGLVMPPRFSFANDTFCVGDTNVARWNALGMVTNNTLLYHWGDGNTSSMSSIGPATHIYSTSGTFTTYAVLSGDSCLGVDTMAMGTIVVNPLPVVTLSPGIDTVLCNTDTLNLSTGGSVTNQWYRNGSIIAGETGSTFTATTDGFYNQTEINASGCTDSSAVGRMVRFGDVPNVDLGADSSLCAGDSICYSLVNPASESYSWSVGNPTASNCFFGSGLVWVQATDSVGCMASDSVDLIFIQLPSPNISVDSSNCPSIDFDSQDPAAVSFAWTFGDGFQSTNSAPSRTYGSNGTYTIVLNDTNQCGTGVDSVTININCILAITEGISGNINLVPNPSNGNFMLTVNLTKAGPISYTITDVTGRQIMNENRIDIRKNWNESINLNSAPGIYFLSVFAGNERSVYRLVIE